MHKRLLYSISILILLGCSKDEKQRANHSENFNKANYMEKTINTKLKTIGILIFEGFLTNEVIAPLDVFAKTDADGKPLFNVILIAKENKSYISEEGLRVLPDFMLDKTPALNVLVVPSSYHPEEQTKDSILSNYIRDQYKNLDYIASHCAGAFLIGKSGIADNKKIVTYVTGGEILKKEYPKLNVMDDSKVSVVLDANIISSNGSLVSYIASLDLLEKMTSKAHRKYVEEQLLLSRLTSNN